MDNVSQIPTHNRNGAAMAVAGQVDQEAAELETAMALALAVEHARPANQIARLASIQKGLVEKYTINLEKLEVQKQVELDSLNSKYDEWRTGREMEIDGIRTNMATRAIEVDSQRKEIASKADEDIRATKTLIAAGQAFIEDTAKDVTGKGGKK